VRFADQLGFTPDRETTPALVALLKRVAADAFAVAGEAKAKTPRLRPFQVAQLKRVCGFDRAPAPDPKALRPRAIATNYLAVLKSRQFRVYTLAASASYGNLFAFISGSSFVLIGVLGVPTTLYGLCFAFCVCGYLVGTLACRRLLARDGIPRALQRGAWLALAASLLLCTLAAAGVHHWAALLLPTFGIFMGHGVVFPCSQAGSVAPFPRLAGAAAGMFGFLLMAAAAGIGTLIGATHNGTVYPLVFTMTACGVATFAAARLGVGRLPPETA
jgi:DHA1 family bicyclomycin/chloramphenicol resistance-like MFS transporter